MAINPPSDLLWLALTVYMEAGGEPYDGKLAVAFVIMNRCTLRQRVVEVVMKPYQFSCWNTDAPTRRHLAFIDSDSAPWQESVKASKNAYANSVSDPTHGATHYLNKALVRVVPYWYDEDKVTAVIGQHTFLRLS